MTMCREVLAIIIFFVGIFFAFQLFVDFSWILLIFSTVFFIMAYFIWPSRKRGHRNDDNTYLDVLEFFIELPTAIVKFLFNFLARMFRDKDGLDIDL